MVKRATRCEPRVPEVMRNVFDDLRSFLTKHLLPPSIVNTQGRYAND